MAFIDLLINTCTVYRWTSIGTDAYGQPIKNYAPVPALTDIKCRHVFGQGREMRIGNDIYIVYDQLFLENVDVTEKDRVLIGSRTYEILSVVQRQNGAGEHHKQCFLRVAK